MTRPLRSDSPWPWIAIASAWLSAAAIIVGLAFALPPEAFTHEDGGFIFVILLALAAATVATWLITVFRR